eukprot:SAG11_NODE_4_length_33019_cov_28.098909_11_plen_363_part_00
MGWGVDECDRRLDFPAIGQGADDGIHGDRGADECLAVLVDVAADHQLAIRCSESQSASAGSGKQCRSRLWRGRNAGRRRRRDGAGSRTAGRKRASWPTGNSAAEAKWGRSRVTGAGRRWLWVRSLPRGAATRGGAGGRRTEEGCEPVRQLRGLGHGVGALRACGDRVVQFPLLRRHPELKRKPAGSTSPRTKPQAGVACCAGGGGAAHRQRPGLLEQALPFAAGPGDGDHRGVVAQQELERPHFGGGTCTAPRSGERLRHSAECLCGARGGEALRWSAAALGRRAPISTKTRSVRSRLPGVVARCSSAFWIPDQWPLTSCDGSPKLRAVSIGSHKSLPSYGTAQPVSGTPVPFTTPVLKVPL